MPKPLELTLLAADRFTAGDTGWTTARGVIRVRSFAGIPEDAIAVRAIELIHPGEHGRFTEISRTRNVH